MNSFKHNLDCEIKKQISEREISPSRDLWEEIQIQTQNNPSKKHHWNRVLLAACFVLICGLGAFLFINNKNEPPVQITKTEEDFLSFVMFSCMVLDAVKHVLKQLDIEKIDKIPTFIKIIDTKIASAE